MLKKQAAMQKTASFQMKWTEVKATEEGRIRIKGFASTPQIDRYDDIVNPSAFASAMSQYMANPVVLLGHNPDKVLGKVIEYNLSADGLEIVAELSNDIDNTFHNIMEKNLRGFSIGFICKAANYREEGNRDIREITDLDLIEISVVSTPANPSSLFTLAKSLRLLFAESEQKEAVEDATATMTLHDDRPGQDQGEAGKTDEQEDTPSEDEKACTDKPKKPKKEGCEDEEDEEPEEASKKDTTENPKTEGEAPTGEAPETPPQEDAQASDKSEPVEAGEKTEETPAAGITEEEAKSLIDAAITEAVKSLQGELKQVSEAFTQLASTHAALESKYTALETSHKQLENDVLKIEVRPGNRQDTPRQAKWVEHLTDAVVLKSIGL